MDADFARDVSIFLTWVLVAFVLAVIGVFCLTVGAGAQEMTEHTGHPLEDLAIHEQFYSTWTRPDHPEWGSCCNREDCRPAEFKREGGQWFFKAPHGTAAHPDQLWWPIPPEKFETARVDGQPRDNPDGRNHVCARVIGDSWFVFCAILGDGM